MVPGTKLGRYEIRSQLGVGGMGEVYLARDEKLNREVAIKVLPADLANNQSRMRRFVQEARTASSLSHPNVAHVYEIEVTDGVHFIAMEYIDGETLRHRISRGELPLGEVLGIATQIAAALSAAHAAGITHRDIKSDNVMLRPDGYAKVLDFGLAKLSEPASEMDEEAPTRAMVNTDPGTVMGTVSYMSPEQARGQAVDARTDIWSFGVLIYQMVSHHLPFEGTSNSDIIASILGKEPPPMARYARDVPEALEWIVTKALTKDPEERYQTAKEMMVDLRRLKQRLDAHAEIERSSAPDTARLALEVSTSIQAGSVGSSAQPIHTVSTAGSTPPAPSSAEYIVSEIKQHKIGAALIMTALVVGAVALIFGFKFFGRNNASLQSRKITRLTNSGKVGSAAISPDGKYVVYSTLDEAGQSSLWVKYLATASNVQIVAPAGPDVIFGQPTFSPDGNYIYYLRNERGSSLGVLYQVPVLGGTSKKLLEYVSRISFSPDGKRFVFSRRYPGEGEDALIVVNADGTGEQKLATRKHPDYLIPGAAWSPDGQTIACPVGGFTGGYYRSVAVIQVSDGSQRPLTSHRWNDAQRVAWLSDGSGVVTTAQEQVGEPYQIWRVSFPDGEAQTLTSDLSDYRNVGLTADSSTLVAVLYDTTSNISVAPYGGWNSARQLTSSKSNGGAGTVWTPDGKIVYDSRASGNPDIWIVDADGRNQKQLTDDAYAERSLSLSPDGRHVVFDSTRSGTLQIWRIDIDGTNAKQLTSGPGLTPSYSPDGEWVFYTTFGAGGFSIWKVPIDGGEPVQVIHKYAFTPSVSPDGKMIACYYVDEKTRASKIALFPLAGGEPVKIFDLLLPVTTSTSPVRWLPDGSGLTYVSTRGGVSNIWLQPLDGGPARQLTDFKTDVIFSFDWSRDGKQLACSRGTERRDVILINNFR